MLYWRFNSTKNMTKSLSSTKKKYALNLSAICNFDKEFIYISTKWFDSLHDAKIFVFIHLYQQSQEYFSLRKYFFDDAIYTNINFMIFFYKASKKNRSNNKKFNSKLSRIRVDIKHVFDMLKKRWQNFVDLRLQIKDKRQYKYVVQWIIVCLILHNVLLKTNSWNERNE